MATTPLTPSPPPSLSMPPFVASPPFPPFQGDAFASWLLSFVAWELPLRQDQQAILVSIVGLYVLMSIILFVLVALVGVTAACDDIFALIRGECCLCWARFHGSKPGTFVLIDDHIDIEAAAIAAEQIGRATPRTAVMNERLVSFRGEREASDMAAPLPLSPGAVGSSIRSTELRSGMPLDNPQGLAAKEGEMTGVSAAQKLKLDTSCASSGAATSRGMASHRCESPQLSHRPATARSSVPSSLSARVMATHARQKPEEQLNGWQNRTDPSWYGV